VENLSLGTENKLATAILEAIFKVCQSLQIVWGLVRINQYFAYFLMAAALEIRPQCS
jgi:hypothetical protein